MVESAFPGTAPGYIGLVEGVLSDKIARSRRIGSDAYDPIQP